MEEQLHQAHARDHQHRHEKEISITNLVKEERKIIEDRFNEELERLRIENGQKLSKENRELINAKNKNEKISRQILDKETQIMNLQSEVAVQQAEIKSLMGTLDLS